MKKIIFSLALFFIVFLSFAQQPGVSAEFDRGYHRIDSLQQVLDNAKVADQDSLIKVCQAEYYSAAKKTNNLLEYALLLNKSNWCWTEEAELILQQKINPQAKKILSDVVVSLKVIEPTAENCDDLIRLSIDYKKSFKRLSFEELMLVTSVFQFFTSLEKGDCVSLTLDDESKESYQECLRSMERLANESNCPYKKEVLKSFLAIQ